MSATSTTVPVTPDQTVTPGPWETAYRQRPDGNYAQEVWGTDGEIVATAGWAAKPIDEKGAIGNYRETNARLIAAAPDLLEALRDVTEWIHNWSPDFVEDDEWPATDAKLRAAILKATFPTPQREEA